MRIFDSFMFVRAQQFHDMKSQTMVLPHNTVLTMVERGRAGGSRLKCGARAQRANTANQITRNQKANLVKCFFFCSRFSHPYVRSRLEKLMGSNLVNLTDRPFMENLKKRILEDYELSMNKRIRNREVFRVCFIEFETQKKKEIFKFFFENFPKFCIKLKFVSVLATKII